MIDIHSFFEIEKTLEFVNYNGSKRVALQFPDEWLEYSVPIVRQLEQAIGTDLVKFYIMADTSYAPCCVDEVNAQHINADAIVHYGPACMSKTNRLPVCHIFGKGDIIVTDLINAIITNETLLENGCVVYCDIEYSHIIPILEEELKTYEQINVAFLAKNKVSFDAIGLKECSGYCWKPLETEYAFLFVGKREVALNNLQLNFMRRTIYQYNPSNDDTCVKECGKRRKTLLRRFYLIQKAKDAQLIGIVIGTLSNDKYLETIERLKDTIRAAGKEYYVVSVGKINVPKLANLPEIDIYCLVACPFTILLDSDEFFRDIVTPFDVTMALVRGKEWTGEYSTDYRSILEDESVYECPSTEQDEIPRYSMISGKLVQDTKSYQCSDETAVASRAPGTLSRLPSVSDRVASRTFNGLEPNYGQTPIAKPEPGLNGIARTYTRKEQD